MKIQGIIFNVFCLILVSVTFSACSTSKDLRKSKLSQPQQEELDRQEEDLKRQQQEIQDLKRQEYQNRKFEKYSK